MKEQLLSTLENSRNYTLAVAEAMPDSYYQFNPIETVWNFGELLHHIAYGIVWWQDNYIKGIKTDWNPPAVKNTKKQVITDIQQAYDTLKKTITALKPDDVSVQGFHSTIDHITHHRGQAVTYLRCKGIAAPEYVY